MDDGEATPAGLDLYRGNHPARFWRLRLDPSPPAALWEEAAHGAAAELPSAARQQGLDRLLWATLGEGQFGASHWRLSQPRRLYYLLKPLLPRLLRMRLRRLHAARARRSFPLDWPIEDRYRRFLWATVGGLMTRLGVAELPFLFFWPAGARFALVLTHDVEDDAGQRFAGRVADLEEGLGFRSSFNFVSERYRLDWGLIGDLRRRGFEVGVHGLRHDGHEYDSWAVFESSARRVNLALTALGAAGYRAPMTHRNPVWMQALEIEYDTSFFDSDPFEPLPGGTMSLWPFEIGRFLELPYTLPQDSTLIGLLGERTPRLWMEKVEYVRRHHGLALLNSHPDYLRAPRHWSVYEAFLGEMCEHEDYWHDLPRAVARWWRRRACADQAAMVPGGTEAQLCRRADGTVEVVPPVRGEPWAPHPGSDGPGPEENTDSSHIGAGPVLPR
jgi:hypothetical protein